MSLLLRSYSWDYLQRQSVSILRRLLLVAINRREEQKAWEMWLALYPSMVVPQPGAKQPSVKFQPFSKFLAKAQGVQPKNPELTAEEIIAKYEEVRKRHQKKA